MSYNGHKNRNHWNVALWLFNEYDLYLLMESAISITNTRDSAAKYILKGLHKQGHVSTPDGVRYAYTAIRAALVGWES